jgi:hypothetical protein
MNPLRLFSEKWHEHPENAENGLIAAANSDMLATSYETPFSNPSLRTSFG